MCRIKSLNQIDRSFAVRTANNPDFSSECDLAMMTSWSFHVSLCDNFPSLRRNEKHLVSHSIVLIVTKNELTSKRVPSSGHVNFIPEGADSHESSWRWKQRHIRSLKISIFQIHNLDSFSYFRNVFRHQIKNNSSNLHHEPRFEFCLSNKGFPYRSLFDAMLKRGYCSDSRYEVFVSSVLMEWI